MKKYMLVLFMSLFIFSSCNKESGNPVSPPPPPPPPVHVGNFVLGGNTVQISKSSEKDISSVSPTKIVFSSNQNFKQGEILFSDGYFSKAPKGFLRKVNSVAGGDVYTSYASIEEAFSKGDMDFTIPSSSLNKVDAKGVTPKINSTKSISYSLNYLIYDQDGNPSTTDDQLKLEGSLTLDGIITGGLHFPPFKVNAGFNFTNTIDLNLVATGNINYHTEKTLFTAEGAPIVVSGIVLTPAISVKFIPDVAVSGKATGGIHDVTRLNASLGFEKVWNISQSFSNVFTAKPVKVNLEGKIKGTLLFQLNLYLFELIGPGVNFGPYTELNVNINQNPWWVLYAGAETNLTVNTRGIASSIGNYSKALVETKKEIANSGIANNPPNATFYITPDVSKINTSTPVTFYADSSSDDKTPRSQLVARWDFDGNGNYTAYSSITNHPTHTYAIAGNYNPTVEVKDEGGLTSKASLYLTVSQEVKNPVFNYSKFSPPNGSTTSSTDLTFSCGSFVPNPDYTLYLGSYEPSLSEFHTGSDSSYHLGNFFPVGTVVYYKWNVKNNQGVDSTTATFSFTVGGSGSTGPEFSTVTDSRDGHVYKTVKIGNDWWLAENLDYKTPNSVYYNNNESAYKDYGRLYTWQDAQDASIPGWHVPTKDELQSLINYTGGDLKETGTNHWDSPNTGAKDNFGFSGFGGGAYTSLSGFFSLNKIGTFWSSTIYDPGINFYGYILPLENSTSQVILMPYEKNAKCSVRLIKNK